jgi:predicted TIM-barrel fold metal-dependent hydrolase
MKVTDWFIDADTHITEPGDVWTTRLPQRFRDRAQVWACTFFEEFAPQKLVDVIGADRIMFETDYPHPICLYGNVRDKIDAALAGHPAELWRKILFGNAVALYDVVEPDRPTEFEVS